MKLPALALALLLPALPPRPIAIKDATVHVAPGRTLEKAVVVLRDGLVADVGADVPVPPDAEVVDGQGLHVYAGFVDARTTLGLGTTQRTPEAL
ncbi:MAG TPA: amidohydrolase, partial [Planctomycetota bacterium]|nr:amidohydrolase [Planctomycetota bacterium]